MPELLLQPSGTVAWALFTLIWGGNLTCLIFAIMAALRRRLSGDALAIGLSTALIALALAPALLALAKITPVRGIESVIVWGGTAATMSYAGALAGVVKRRIGVWESYLVLVLVTPPVVAFTGDPSLAHQVGTAVLVADLGFVFAVVGGFLATRYYHRGLIWWILTQIGLFLWLVLYVLIVGIFEAIAGRRFHWRAFLVGLAIMAGGVVSVGLSLYLASETLFLWRDTFIWAGTLSALTLAGFWIGKVGKRLGYWECYLATIIVFVLISVHLAVGWHVIFSFGPGDTQSHFEFLVRVPPGQKILGSMWPRMVGFGALIGFLLTLFGASLAFLLFSDEGKLDARFTFEWLIGRRHLLTGRRGLISVTAVVAVLGVSLGVASLVAVTAVMSGYQEDIQTKILSTNAHFVIQKYGIDFTEYDEIAKEGLTHPEVLAATPFTFNEAMLATTERAMGVLIKGVVPAQAGTVTGVESNLCREVGRSGRCIKYASMASPHLPELLAERDGLPAIIVGSELFKKIDVPVGSIVTLTTPVGIAGARGNAPKRMTFRLTGAFRSGMHDFDVRLAYLELGASQRLMGLGQAVNGVEFKVSDPQRVELIADKVLQTIGGYPYRSLDWRELNIGIFTALRLQKIAMFLVLIFIIVVAAFNIASTLFMAVVEKAREIAVLKSMGSRNGSIMKIFVIEGWLVGGAGTLAGLLLGLLVCFALAEADIAIAADVYMVEALQVRVQPLEIVLTAAATMVISHLATLYPALKAARQRPVDAMRYE
jgi:lipoprotein-releasing system permease protein